MKNLTGDAREEKDSSRDLKKGKEMEDLKSTEKGSKTDKKSTSSPATKK